MRTLNRFTTTMLLVMTVSACANPTAPTSAPTVAAGTAADSTAPSIPGGDAAVSPDAEAGSVTTTATRIPARYFSVAFSGGFNRNDRYGWAYGPSYQGVLNTALSNCQSSAGTLCEHVAICGPSNGLGVARPWVAVYRTSVYERSYLDRGVTGVACGHSSEAAAISYARAACGRPSCQRVISRRIP